MNILVVYASRHGVTQGIAERVVGRLRAAGFEAHAQLANAVGDVDRYEAFVIGSMCHLGHWQPAATEFVRRHQACLAHRPTWLFTSGPVGSDPGAPHPGHYAAGDPDEVVEFRATIGPRDHQVFFGVPDPGLLEPQDPALGGARSRTALLGSDPCEWRRVQAWADAIASELTTSRIRVPSGVTPA